MVNVELNELENNNNLNLLGDVSKLNRKVLLSKKIGKKILREDSGILLEDEIKYGMVMDKIVEDVYDMGKKIGDGNFVDVCECIDKIIKKEFVLKIVDKVKIWGKE